MGMNHQSDLQGRHLGDDISGDVVNDMRQAWNHTVMSWKLRCHRLRTMG
jgi:hypothetical protein